MSFSVIIGNRVAAWAGYILTPISWLAAGLLLLFTARRWLFILGALLPRKPADWGSALPPVLLLAPFRNELASLPELFLALDCLDYPAGRLTVVLIDDGSSDGSGTLAQAWLKDRSNWRVLSLARNVGKAAALNEALATFSQGDIVAVYDADERPLPDTLRRLVAPFAEANVAGVSGRRAVSNALASPAASYTTLEGLAHQFVTLRAKDRLKLAPALLGANCAYRRSALARAGGFQPGALLEDSDLTLKLARAGWQIRFEPGAISYHAVPQTVSGYWRQHARWARGFNEVARTHLWAILGDKKLPLMLRLELAAFSLGYLDRLALLAGVMLLLYPRSGRRLLLARAISLSLITPLWQVVAALKISRASPRLWARLVWLPLFFGLDIAMAAAGFWGALRQAPQRWEERRARK
jgi:cellulose synthase/poly-beta-1,6-N-acetylglucosamine synthase-like glycosyltransferase